jgi:putative membrane protein
MDGPGSKVFRPMRRILFAAIVLALATAGVIYSGIGLSDVAEAVVLVGWGIALVITARIVVTVLLAYAWWLVVPGGRRPSLHDCVKIRLVRDAINALLPSAQIGGDIVGARLLVSRGVGAALSAASLVTDVFLQVVSQFAFTIAGLLLLIWQGGGGGIVSTVAGGLLVAIPAIAGFVLVQKRGVADVVLGALRKLAGGREWGAFAATEAFYDALRDIQQHWGTMTRSSLVHVLAWVIGSLEVYAALHFLGYPVSFGEAVVIESLGQAVRGAGFAIPGAIGVQEGGFVLLCAVYGIPAEPALAVSLVKRIADLALGIPGLLLWHRLERRPISGVDRPAV